MGAKRGGTSGQGASRAVASRPGVLLAILIALSVSLASIALSVGGAPASGWGTAELIETDNAGEAWSPQVAVDASGNAVAVWWQSDGTRNNTWANRYVVGSGWGTAEIIGSAGNTGPYEAPQVAVDASGNAFAVWWQSDGTRNNTWANRYVVGSGWGTAELIETDNAGEAYSPQVAVDASGNAVAVWIQSDGSRFNIWANRYVVDSGWGTAELIETDDTGDAYEPQVAVDGSGNAVAVWGQYDGTPSPNTYGIWANRYVVGSGWGTAELIETDDAGIASSPQVVVDASGNAVAVWWQEDGTRDNIWANRYAAGSGWGTAELIETGSGDAWMPQVAVDASGNAVAVWWQSDGTRLNIWANRYVVGSGWGTAELIETGNTGTFEAPQVAVDASGNAVVVWSQSRTGDWSDPHDIWANRYVVGSGWGTAELIETDNAGDAANPQVAVDADGNAFAVWRQSDGTLYNIWAGIFDETLPPVLTMSSPEDGASTNRSTIWVAGTTEPGARVSVNGISAFVSTNGSFGLMLALLPGMNLINATAWDDLGNKASALMNVTYEDPLPALERQLAETQANLAAAQTNVSTLQAALAATESELAAANAALDAAEGRVAILEQDANVTGAELAAAQANLTIEQARVATLEAQADATAADLGAAQARLAALEAGAAVTDAELEATRADLTAAQAELASAREDVDQSRSDAQAASSEAASASSQATLAMILAVVGVVAGVGAMVAGMRARRRAGDTDPPLSSNPPPEKPPSPK